MKITIEIDDLEVGRQIATLIEALQKPAAPKATRKAASKAPEAIEDKPIDPITARQDAADEQAEAAVSPGGDLTIEDVRKAMLRFSEKFGMGVALKRFDAILGCRIDDIEPTQEALAAAIARVDAAINEGVQPSKANTISHDREGVMEALKRYAIAYDGTEDMRSAPNMQVDCEQLLSDTVGVRGINKIPEGRHGDVVTAIMSAVNLNPFNRKRLS